MRVSTLFQGHIKSYGVGHACQSILEGMFEAGADISLFCGSADQPNIRPYNQLAIPVWGQSIGYRILSQTRIQKYLEWRYCKQLRAGNVAYIWPGSSRDVFRTAKRKGCIVVTENINTHPAASKAILDREYVRLGLPPNHPVSVEIIADENAKLALADYVFSPSPEVSRSLRNVNVPEEKIIDSSYGLDAGDLVFPEEIPARRPLSAIPTALFVGRLGIRKGVHLLLDYWIKANVPGVLKLVGNIEADAKHLIEPYMQHPTIEFVQFSTDLKKLYREADVFIFPSLEEGSPLVTYLALGAGLPSLVTPMGGGGVIDDEKEGRVIEPHDESAWVKAIRDVFLDAGLRNQFSLNAYLKAQQYFWTDVGVNRYHKLSAKF